MLVVISNSFVFFEFQLNLSGLHIRYEDGREKCRYSVGLVIDKLLTQSTDSSWVSVAMETIYYLVCYIRDAV